MPKRLVIDNLKSGIITPNLYDPKLNLAYQEMAEHYGCFIDPARVRKPKDKGKIERTVPLVREMFRKFNALEPNLDMARADAIGPRFKQLVLAILSRHAKLNYRRALALLNFARQNPTQTLEALRHFGYAGHASVGKPAKSVGLQKLFVAGLAR